LQGRADEIADECWECHLQEKWMAPAACVQQHNSAAALTIEHLWQGAGGRIILGDHHAATIGKLYVCLALPQRSMGRGALGEVLRACRRAAQGEHVQDGKIGRGWKMGRSEVHSNWLLAG